MRTTIRLDNELLKQAKQHAYRTGKSLPQVIEDALRASIGRREKSSSRRRVKLVTSGTGGLQPGVDLEGDPRGDFIPDA